MLRFPLVAAAALAAAVTPATASAAAREATYKATFKAAMSERWSYDERSTDDCKLTGALCTRVTAGSGSAKLTVHSRRPTRVLVMRSTPKRLPTIGVGTGEGIPLVGSYLRSGSLRTDYAGPWDAANPDVAQPASGCGKRTVRAAVVFSWRGRGKVSPLAELPPMRDKCPDGPPSSVTWAKDASPSFSDALASVAPSKFLGTKQFTIHGRRTFTGAVKPVSTSSRQGSYSERGDHTVTWQWEATFRRVKR